MKINTTIVLFFAETFCNSHDRYEKLITKPSNASQNRPDVVKITYI